ncbi:hypothetical protein VitviT2T_023968 [Vitis vinifera]|uniref:Pentatricopeptide repeat-containing protein n=1 Tax=Vitis vinifera TaxID=29760 RepID=A0ABY9DGU0_VITVI|nr:hypothetical protein VitviT2T_023968 [Vitis vinifera]
MAACVTLAFLNCGQQIHGRIIRRGLDGNLALSNALIDMYSKCGNIANSHQVFGGMSRRDLVSWTTMMIGYGTHSHAGLVDEGLRYFKLMVGDYNISPDQEIYGCEVDLLGRAGKVEEAYELIESMPFKPDECVWGPFLGACKAHRSGSCGTGVFFPRGTGNPLDSRKKQGCSTALIPARVAQALKLNFDEMGVVSPSLGGCFSLQHDAAPGRRNSLYPPQKQHWPAPPAMKHQEMDVPRGWTH